MAVIIHPALYAMPTLPLIYLLYFRAFFKTLLSRESVLH